MSLKLVKGYSELLETPGGWKSWCHSGLSGTSARYCLLLLSHHISSTKELTAAAPSGRDITGSQGHAGERSWEDRHCLSWERGLWAAELASLTGFEFTHSPSLRRLCVHSVPNLAGCKAPSTFCKFTDVFPFHLPQILFTGFQKYGDKQAVATTEEKHRQSGSLNTGIF